MCMNYPYVTFVYLWKAISAKKVSSRRNTTKKRGQTNRVCTFKNNVPKCLEITHQEYKRKTCREKRAEKNVPRNTCREKHVEKSVPRETCPEQSAEKYLRRKTCREKRGQRKTCREKRGENLIN